MFEALVSEQDLAQDDSKLLERPCRGPLPLLDGDWTVELDTVQEDDGQ